MKVLLLILSAEPWELMENCRKSNEYRFNNPKTNWIKNRLIDSKSGKDIKYNAVLMPNGYGKVRYFARTFLGYKIAKRNYTVTYSNGFKVHVKKGTYNIKLGSVIKRGNINSKELF
jgi:hypothetical protein